MINLIRGTIESRINDELINQIDDYNFLIENDKVILNSKNLVLNNIIELIENIEGNVDFDIYFNKFTDKELALSKDYNINIKENQQIEKVDFMILNKLSDLDEIDKINSAISLMKDEEDIKLVNESINKGTLTINSLIRKLVVKYA